jgi:hypothetical protein
VGRTEIERNRERGERRKKKEKKKMEIGRGVDSSGPVDLLLLQLVETRFAVTKLKRRAVG